MFFFLILLRPTCFVSLPNHEPSTMTFAGVDESWVWGYSYRVVDSLATCPTHGMLLACLWLRTTNNAHSKLRQRSLTLGTKREESRLVV